MSVLFGLLGLYFSVLVARYKAGGALLLPGGVGRRQFSVGGRGATGCHATTHHGNSLTDSGRPNGAILLSSQLLLVLLSTLAHRTKQI